MTVCKKNRTHFILLLLLTALLLELVSTANSHDTYAAAKTGINKTNASISISQTITLKVTGVKGKVKWTSSNKSVATVTQKGRVTGVKPDKVTIQAKVGKKTFKCRISVIGLNKDSISLISGHSKKSD